MLSVGQVVVCVDDKSDAPMHRAAAIAFPTLGGVYTVRGFWRDNAIWLAEIVNRQRLYGRYGKLEPSFMCRRFRPAKPTDIGTFRSMLAPKPAEVAYMARKKKSRRKERRGTPFLSLVSQPGRLDIELRRDPADDDDAVIAVPHPHHRRALHPLHVAFAGQAIGEQLAGHALLHRFGDLSEGTGGGSGEDQRFDPTQRSVPWG
jgi:hypothetical protein